MLPTAQAANGPKHITAYAVNNANYTGGIEGGEGQQGQQTSFALLYATTPHPPQPISTLLFQKVGSFFPICFMIANHSKEQGASRTTLS